MIMDIIKKVTFRGNPHFSGQGVIAEEAFLIVIIAHKDTFHRLVCELGSIM